MFSKRIIYASFSQTVINFWGFTARSPGGLYPCTPMGDFRLQIPNLHLRSASSNKLVGSTPPLHAVRPSGLLCCGSDGLERIACMAASEILLCQPALSDDIWRLVFLLLLAYQRIRGFAFMRYITHDWLIDWLIAHRWKKNSANGNYSSLLLLLKSGGICTSCIFHLHIFVRHFHVLHFSRPLWIA